MKQTTTVDPLVNLLINKLIQKPHIFHKLYNHNTPLEKKDFLNFLNRKQTENQMKRNYLIRPGTAYNPHYDSTSLRNSSNFNESRVFSAQSRSLMPLFPLNNNDRLNEFL